MNLTFTTTTTKALLSSLVLSISLLRSCVTASTIDYGDKVFLQNDWMDNRWLSGSRSGGNEGVVTRDHLRSTYERVSVANTYKWIVRSTPGDGDRDYVDPKAGSCLAYGDTIYLQNNWMDDRWLSGSRSSGNEGVITRDHLRSYYEEVTVADTYAWIVRSCQGSGYRNYQCSRKGECVEDGDLLFLQNEWIDHRWLNGSRSSGNEGVKTRDKLASFYERSTVAPVYNWIIRTTPGDGSRP